MSMQLGKFVPHHEFQIRRGGTPTTETDIKHHTLAFLRYHDALFDKEVNKNHLLYSVWRGIIKLVNEYLNELKGKGIVNETEGRLEINTDMVKFYSDVFNFVKDYIRNDRNGCPYTANGLLLGMKENKKLFEGKTDEEIKMALYFAFECLTINGLLRQEYERDGWKWRANARQRGEIGGIDSSHDGRYHIFWFRKEGTYADDVMKYIFNRILFDSLNNGKGVSHKELKRDVIMSSKIIIEEYIEKLREKNKLKGDGNIISLSDEENEITKAVMEKIIEYFDNASGPLALKPFVEYVKSKDNDFRAKLDSCEGNPVNIFYTVLEALMNNPDNSLRRDEGGMYRRNRSQS